MLGPQMTFGFFLETCKRREGRQEPPPRWGRRLSDGQVRWISGEEEGERESK
jgi:hypothetical protein